MFKVIFSFFFGMSYRDCYKSILGLFTITMCLTKIMRNSLLIASKSLPPSHFYIPCPLPLPLASKHAIYLVLIYLELIYYAKFVLTCYFSHTLVPGGQFFFDYSVSLIYYTYCDTT